MCGNSLSPSTTIFSPVVKTMRPAPGICSRSGQSGVKGRPHLLVVKVPKVLHIKLGEMPGCFSETCREGQLKPNCPQEETRLCKRLTHMLRFTKDAHAVQVCHDHPIRVLAVPLKQILDQFCRTLVAVNSLPYLFVRPKGQTLVVEKGAPLLV